MNTRTVTPKRPQLVTDRGVVKPTAHFFITVRSDFSKSKGPVAGTVNVSDDNAF